MFLLPTLLLFWLNLIYITDAADIKHLDVAIRNENDVQLAMVQFVNTADSQVLAITKTIPFTNQLIKFSATTDGGAGTLWEWRERNIGVLSNTGSFEYRFDEVTSRSIGIKAQSTGSPISVTLNLKDVAVQTTAPIQTTTMPEIVETTTAPVVARLTLEEQISVFNQGSTEVGLKSRFLVLMFSKLVYTDASLDAVNLLLKVAEQKLNADSYTTLQEYSVVYNSNSRRNCFEYNSKAAAKYLNDWKGDSKTVNDNTDSSSVVNDDSLNSFCATEFSHVFSARGLYLTTANLTKQQSSEQTANVPTCVPIDPRCPPPIVQIRTGKFRRKVAAIFDAPLMTYKVGDVIQLWADVIRLRCLDNTNSDLKMNWYVVNILEFGNSFLSSITEQILSDSKSALPMDLTFENTVGLRLSPDVLPIGAYLVVFSVKEWPYCGSEGVFITDAVQLKISFPKLHITIDGGSYIEWPLVNSDSVLELQATTSASRGLMFTWLCYKEAYDNTGFHHAIFTLKNRQLYTVDETSRGYGCFGNGYILSSTDDLVKMNNQTARGIINKGNILHISGDTFNEGGQYVFTIFVARREDNATSYSKQTVNIFQPQSSLSQLVRVTIACIENCKEHVIPTTIMYLVSKCKKCHEVRLSPHETLVKEWTVVSPNQTPNLRHRFNWNRDSAVKKNSDNLILLPSAFQETGRYKIILQIFLQSAYNKKLISTAQYRVMVVKGPNVGLCVVEPDYGIALKTMFSIKCTNFGDKSDNLLMYEMILCDNAKQSFQGNQIVIYKGMESKVSGLYLPVGNPKFGYRKKVRILVTNQQGIPTLTSAFVSVVPPNSEKIEELIDETVIGKEKHVSQLSRLVKAGSIDDAIRLIISASSLTKPKSSSSNHSAVACSKILKDLGKIKVTNPETVSQLMGVIPNVLKSWSTRFTDKDVRNVTVPLRHLINVTINYLIETDSSSLLTNSRKFKEAGVSTLKALTDATKFVAKVPNPEDQIKMLEDKVKVHAMLLQLLKPGEDEKTFFVSEQESLDIGYIDASNTYLPIGNNAEGSSILLPTDVSDSVQKAPFALSTMYYSPFNSGTSISSDNINTQVNLPTVSLSIFKAPNNSNVQSGRVSSNTFEILLPLKTSANAQNDSVDQKAIAKLLLPPPCNGSIKSNSNSKVAVNKGECGSVEVKLNLNIDNLNTKHKRSAQSSNGRSLQDRTLAFIVLRPKKSCRIPRSPCIRVSFSRELTSSRSCNPVGNCSKNYEVIKTVTLPNMDNGMRVNSFTSDPWSIPTNKSLLDEIRGHGSSSSSQVTMLVEDLQEDALFKERDVNDKDNYQSITVNVIKAECYVWNYKLNGWDTKKCGEGRMVVGGKLHCQCQISESNSVSNSGILTSVSVF
ncbi:uncharacterized protein LOC113474173 [Ciona intestinalis]